MAVGIAAQFVVLPAVTYTLTLLGVAPSIALGMILVACCPPGNISNLLTHRQRQCGAVGVDDGDLQRAVRRAHAAELCLLGRHAPHGVSPCSRRLRWTRWKWWAIIVIIGVPFVLGVWCRTSFRISPNASSRLAL
jgi:BASS family bile acid:Na+ symporter